MIDSWVQEGVAEILARTHCQVSIATLALTSGTKDYTLPTQVMAIEELFNTSGGTDYQLQRAPLEEMIRLRRAVGSTPSRYYTLIGFDSLLLYPTPGTGETLTIYYVPRPATLAAGDSPTDIPAEWHKAIEVYALWQGADYDDDQSSAQGERYHQQYEAYIREIKKAMRRMGGKRIAPAVPGRRRSLLLPSSPSQDTGW